MTDHLTNEESEKKRGQPWPVHSSQFGLIEELLQAGVPVGLTYIVTLTNDDQNEVSDAAPLPEPSTAS